MPVLTPTALVSLTSAAIVIKEQFAMEKMWAGRFHKQLNAEADDFNSSISFDSRMYKQDIKGSMAHAAMLAAQGIITKEESESIIGGLETILKKH